MLLLHDRTTPLCRQAVGFTAIPQTSKTDSNCDSSITCEQQGAWHSVKDGVHRGCGLHLSAAYITCGNSRSGQQPRRWRPSTSCL